jgi:hypothetical protein
LESFGPLIKHAVVPGSILCDSVRRTAIRAHRACLKAQFPESFAGRSQNYKERRGELDAMLDRYGKDDVTYEDFLVKLFNVSP